MALVVPSHYERQTGLDRGQYGDIVGAVQDGDPTVGWRGDPSMDVWRKGSQIQVYGFDRSGERYCAATVSLTEDDWRRTLLRKLRDGDWQNPNAYEDVFASVNDRLERDRARETDEKRLEVAEKFAFALGRDNGIKRFF